MTDQPIFDVAVVGLGAMGSAAVWQLAKQGVNVIGLEQHEPGHALGSSHGQTRLIRKAYFEHPDYVPLLHRSYELWRELGEEAEQQLLHETGVVIFGPPNGNEEIEGVRHAAKTHSLSIEEWGAEEIKTKSPLLQPPADHIGMFEPTGGYVWVEDSIKAACRLATKAGATIESSAPVRDWNKKDGVFNISTTKREVKAKKLVVTAGPWTRFLMTSEELPLKVHRVVQFWFKAKAAYKPEKGFPCFAFALPSGFFYGFPAIDGRLKCALHAPGAEVLEPSKVNRSIEIDDLKTISSFVGQHIPGLDSSPEEGRVCLYTMTPDQHFIIDKSRMDADICYAAGFSGHGFKFMPVVGEILSDFVTKGQTELPAQFLKRRD